MAYYETVLIARQDISSGQVDAITSQVTELLTKDGGKISRQEYWGLRNLAYRINKNRKGHYVLMNYEAAPDAVHEMERQMRLHDDVLRYMTVRTEELPEEASVMMQKRDERGDRGDRGDRGSRDRGDRGGDRGDRGGDRGGRGGDHRGGDRDRGDRDRGDRDRGGDRAERTTSKGDE